MLTPPLQDEIRALMEQVSKVPLLMEKVLELKTQVSELLLLKEEVLELKTQVSELKEALEQNKQKEKQKKTPNLDASSSATSFVSSRCGWHGPGHDFKVPYELTSCGEGQRSGDFAKHWQSMYDTVGWELVGHGIQGWLDRMWWTAEKNQAHIRHN